MARTQVRTTPDHISRIAKASPVDAIEELIWNGLDAGGDTVEVKFTQNKMHGIEEIQVIDHGRGIGPQELPSAFGEVGNSLKPTQKTNDLGRRLVGSEGQGRLKALSLSARPVWRTQVRQNGHIAKYAISISSESPDFYDTTEIEQLKEADTGTIVTLPVNDKACDSLLSQSTRSRLTQRFALYLSEYPDTKIIYDGLPLTIDEYVARKVRQSITFGPDHKIGVLTIIEWRFSLDSRKLYFCEDSGFARHDIKLLLQAPGLMYTAYLRAEVVREWAESNSFGLHTMSPMVQEVVDKSKDEIRKFIRERLALNAADVVEGWKRERVYPYSEGEEGDPIVAAEQQVFDSIAVQVHTLHPTFSDTDAENKRLTLVLIRKALESNPSTLASLLRSLVKLSDEDQKQLAGLLNQTTLGSIIRAAGMVTERLDVIAAFQKVLYEKDWKKQLLERTQLHRLLAHELWILGEEFQLATDDDNLREVLQKHLQILGRDSLAEDAEVRLIDGKEGIPDLMLWHRGKADRNLFEHLVIELKRPRDKLGREEVQQIEAYAMAVAADERFNTSRVRWRFVLLGNDLDAYAETKASQDNLPPGCVYKRGLVSVYVQRWADVLEDARLRYEYIRDKLDTKASSEKGMENWKKKFNHLFEGRGARKGRDHAATRTGRSQVDELTAEN